MQVLHIKKEEEEKKKREEQEERARMLKEQERIRRDRERELRLKARQDEDVRAAVCKVAWLCWGCYDVFTIYLSCQVKVDMSERVVGGTGEDAHACCTAAQKTGCHGAIARGAVQQAHQEC